MVGRAAEIAKPGGVERIGHADAFAVVERLRIGFEIEPAAFDECDGNAAADQLARNGDPCRARADNGKVGVDGGAVRHLPPVNEHLVVRLRKLDR